MQRRDQKVRIYVIRSPRVRGKLLVAAMIRNNFLVTGEGRLVCPCPGRLPVEVLVEVRAVC